MIKLGRFTVSIKIAAIIVTGLLFILMSSSNMPPILRIAILPLLIFVVAPGCWYILTDGKSGDNDGMRVLEDLTPRVSAETQKYRNILNEKVSELREDITDEKKKHERRRRMIR